MFKLKHKLVFLTMTGAIFFLFTVSPVLATKDDKELNRLNEVIQLIESMHLDNPKKNQLVDEAIKGAIQSLNDPWTQYFSEKEAENFQNSLNGETIETGIRLVKVNENYKVMFVNPDSPAGKNDIKKDDVILEVNGVKITNDEEALGAVYGEEGKVVQLLIKRGETTKLIALKYQKSPNVTTKWFDNGIGYIHMKTFSLDAGKEFSIALTELKDKGMKSLIFDLRNNPGGSMEAANQIAAQFMKEGVISFIRTRDGKEKAVEVKDGTAISVPVYLLVNDRSASASEYFAGTMKDHKIATIIGTKTYGKGLAQNPIQLANGGMLKITFQEFLTPNKTKIDQVGITPNIEMKSEMSQIIKALQLSGVKEIKITSNQQHFSINNVAFDGFLYMVENKGRVYFSSRMLAAMIDAEIKWNEELQAVEVKKDNRSQMFSVSDQDIILEDGTSALDIARFQQYFPEFKGEKQGDTYILSSRFKNQ